MQNLNNYPNHYNCVYIYIHILYLRKTMESPTFEWIVFDRSRNGWNWKRGILFVIRFSTHKQTKTSHRIHGTGVFTCTIPFCLNHPWIGKYTNQPSPGSHPSWVPAHQAACWKFRSTMVSSPPSATIHFWFANLRSSDTKSNHFTPNLQVVIQEKTDQKKTF